MVRMLRSCIQSLLKLSNSVIAMAGIAMVLYGLWMIRVLNQQAGLSPNPWFIYTFLGLGVAVCLISFSGHIAAEYSNGCCLYVYLGFLLLLLVLEGVLTADVRLNHTWEEDFPLDPTRNLYELEVFVRKNFDFCKWIALSVVSAQGLSILFAVILKALGPPTERHYDTDDEDYADSAAPLLRNSSHLPPHVASNTLYAAKN